MKIRNQEKENTFVNSLEGKKGIFTIKSQKKIQRESPKAIFKVLEFEGTVKYKGDDGHDIERDIKISSTTPLMEADDEGVKKNRGGPLFVTTARNGGEFFHKDGSVMKLAKALDIYETDEFIGKKIVVENTGYWEIDLKTMIDGNHTAEMLEAAESTTKLFSDKDPMNNLVTSENISEEAEA